MIDKGAGTSTHRVYRKNSLDISGASISERRVYPLYYQGRYPSGPWYYVYVRSISVPVYAWDARDIGHADGLDWTPN